MDFAFIFAGFFVGLIVGLTGVGGGSLMTPILIFGFNIQPALAIGTDLLFAAFTKFSGSIHLARKNLINWPIVGLLSTGSIPSALITIYFINHFGEQNVAIERVMTTTLGLALLLTALATLYKILRTKKNSVEVYATQRKALHWSLSILLGSVIGCLVALTSVGAGAIGVMALMVLYPQIPLPRIVASDIAYAVPLTLIAGLGHAVIDSVDWRLLGLLLVGSIPGIWLGIRLVTKISERLLRFFLSLLLLYAGFKLVSI
jgi:uncharacterized membrane protein YfcA